MCVCRGNIPVSAYTTEVFVVILTPKVLLMNWR